MHMSTAALLTWALGAALLACRARRRLNDRHRANSISAAASARRSRFRNQARPAVFVVESARELRDCLKHGLIESSDVVLEVGSQLESVTSALSACCHFLVGVDIHRKPPSAHMKTSQFYRQHSDPSASGLSNVSFAEVDVSDVRAVAACCDGVDVDVICIDAHVFFGHDLTFEVLAMVTALSHLLMPRCFVVKSTALTRLRQQLRPYPPVRNESASLSLHTSSTVTVVAAEWVHDYRMAATEALEAMGSDATCALEIGAHVGATTALLHEKLSARASTTHSYCGCIGVDVSPAIVERAQRLHPEVPFAVADAWDMLTLKRACPPEAHPQLILVDVGGLSGSSGTLDALSLIRTICATFQPSLRVLVIKSSCMRALASSLRSGKAWCRNSRRSASASTAPRTGATAASN